MLTTDQIVRYLGKQYRYPITGRYDGYARKQVITGTCIGYDPRPQCKPEGDYLILKPDSMGTVSHRLHTVLIQDVKEIRDGQAHQCTPDRADEVQQYEEESPFVS